MRTQTLQLDAPEKRSLTAEEQREVIAVAARLQARHEARQADALSVEELEAAAAEAGIEAAFIREAVRLVDRQHGREADATRKRKALRHVFRVLAVAGAGHLIGAAALFLGAPFVAVGIVGLELLTIPVLLMRLGASGEGYAPGWRVRCPGCGRSRDAGELGIIRMGATRRAKKILANCSQCGGLRMVLLEPVPETDPAQPPTGGTGGVEVTPPTEI